MSWKGWLTFKNTSDSSSSDEPAPPNECPYCGQYLGIAERLGFDPGFYGGAVKNKSDIPTDGDLDDDDYRTRICRFKQGGAGAPVVGCEREFYVYSSDM